MEVKIKLSVKDWESYQSFLGSEAPRKYYSGWWLTLINAVVWFLGVVIVMATVDTISSFHWPTAITVCVLFLLIIVNHLINRPRVLLASFAPDIEGSFCGTHYFRLTDESIIAKSDGYTSEHSWFLFKRIVRSHGLVMLFIDTANAFIFPESELADAEAFYLYSKQRVDEHNKVMNTEITS
ncbi:hypothetical protein [Thalassotalea fusca]